MANERAAIWAEQATRPNSIRIGKLPGPRPPPANLLRSPWLDYLDFEMRILRAVLREWNTSRTAGADEDFLKRSYPVCNARCGRTYAVPRIMKNDSGPP